MSGNCRPIVPTHQMTDSENPVRRRAARKKLDIETYPKHGLVQWAGIPYSFLTLSLEVPGNRLISNANQPRIAADFWKFRCAAREFSG